MSINPSRESSAPVALAAGRVAGRAVGRNRWLRGAAVAAGTTLRALGRTLHLLWLELTGFFFLVFALIFASALVREYRAYATGKIGPGKAWTAAALTAVFLYFGATSLWRARRK